MEGRRLKAELENGLKAINLIEGAISAIQYQQRKNKKRLYTPSKIFLKGNHENRLDRYLVSKPEIEGLLDIDNALGLTEKGWSVYDYKEYYYDKGIAYTHAPINGTGKAYSGTAANTHDQIAKAHDSSVVWFHSHKLRVDTFARMGEQIKQTYVINAGCFFEGIPSYAKGSTDAINWWRGVLLINHQNDWDFDITTIRLERLMEQYNG